jgi:ferredoxin
MRIAVDRDKCAGIGLCEATGPSIIELGKDSQARVLHDALPADEITTAQEVVRACPTSALSIID